MNTLFQQFSEANGLTQKEQIESLLFFIESLNGDAFSNYIQDANVLCRRNFIEALEMADAIEIDGQFIRHFEVNDTNSDDDLVLDISINDDSFQCQLTLAQCNESSTTKYNENSWIVSDHEIHLYQLDEIK